MNKIKRKSITSCNVVILRNEKKNQRDKYVVCQKFWVYVSSFPINLRCYVYQYKTVDRYKMNKSDENTDKLGLYSLRLALIRKKNVCTVHTHLTIFYNLWNNVNAIVMIVFKKVLTTRWRINLKVQYWDRSRNYFHRLPGKR